MSVVVFECYFCCCSKFDSWAYVVVLLYYRMHVMSPFVVFVGCVCYDLSLLLRNSSVIIVYFV